MVPGFLGHRGHRVEDAAVFSVAEPTELALLQVHRLRCTQIQIFFENSAGASGRITGSRSFLKRVRTDLTIHAEPCATPMIEAMWPMTVSASTSNGS